MAAIPPPPALLNAASNAALNAMHPLGGFAAGVVPTAAELQEHLDRFHAVSNLAISGCATPAEVGDAFSHLHKVEEAHRGGGANPLGELATKGFCDM